jgi:MFS family permease
LFLGQSVSLLGDQISLIALPLTAVLVLHAGARQMGYLTTAALVPNILFALHAGSWIDKSGHRRRAMILADTARAVLLASLPIAYALGHLTFAQLYVVAFLTGIGSVVFAVAYGSLVASVLPREEYIAGNSLLNGSRAFSYLAGPSLGGVLVQVLRAPYALAADAVSFVCSAIYVARMRTEEPPRQVEEGGVLAGARWLWRTRILRDELGAVATINYFNFIFFALFILFATRTLQIRPGVLGLVLGAGAVGSIAGSTVTGRITRRIGVGPAFALSCLLFPAPLILIPAAHGPRWLVLVMLFTAECFSGFGLMVLDITAGAFSSAITPPHLRARISGAFMVVNNGIRPLGTMTAAFLGSSLGLRSTLWIATVGALAGACWLVRSPILGMRELPEAAA